MPRLPNLSIIAAVAKNNVIGLAGKMPWNLPSDLKRFKRITLGHAVIMGRLTFESIGKPLNGRENIIVSQSFSSAPEGCKLTNNLSNAIELAGSDEFFVIGGAELFKQAVELCSKLYITTVHANPAGDTFFPHVELSCWKNTTHEQGSQPCGDEFPTSFNIWEAPKD